MQSALFFKVVNKKAAASCEGAAFFHLVPSCRAKRDEWLVSGCLRLVAATETCSLQGLQEPEAAVQDAAPSAS